MGMVSVFPLKLSVEYIFFHKNAPFLKFFV